MAIPTEKETLAMLNAETKVKVRIRKDNNNPNYVTERVYVNGVCYQIEVGEYVEVPETVAKLLEEKGII